MLRPPYRLEKDGGAHQTSGQVSTRSVMETLPQSSIEASFFDCLACSLVTALVTPLSYTLQVFLSTYFWFRSWTRFHTQWRQKFVHFQTTEAETLSRRLWNSNPCGTRQKLLAVVSLTLILCLQLRLHTTKKHYFHTLAVTIALLLYLFMTTRLIKPIHILKLFRPSVLVKQHDVSQNSCDFIFG